MVDFTMVDISQFSARWPICWSVHEDGYQTYLQSVQTLTAHSVDLLDSQQWYRVRVLNVGNDGVEALLATNSVSS